MVDCKSWDAWRNEMPGSGDSDLHVTGECTVPSSSIELSLRVGNQGINPDPNVLRMDLHASDPDAGDTMVATKTVTWQGPNRDAKRVVISGAASATIDVRTVS